MSLRRFVYAEEYGLRLRIFWFLMVTQEEGYLLGAENALNCQATETTTSA